MKLKKWLVAMLVLVMGIVAVTGLAACDDKPSGDTVSVTWYDGRTILKEDAVEKGSKLTEWTPEKSGYEFLDWYSESSLTKRFDFDTEINEDIG